MTYIDLMMAIILFIVVSCLAAWIEKFVDKFFFSLKKRLEEIFQYYNGKGFFSQFFSFPILSLSIVVTYPFVCILYFYGMIINKLFGNLINRIVKKKGRLVATKNAPYVELYYKKKSELSIGTIYFASSMLLITFILSCLSIIEAYISLLIGALLLVLLAYQSALDYRVKYGLFGTNYHEAKMLLDFILKDIDKNGKPDKGIVIFNPEQMVQEVINIGWGETQNA